MSIYQRRQGEYGGAAKLRRVNALRRLASAGAVVFDRYVRADPPEFHIRNIDGEQRTPTGKEVPAYLLGGSDVWKAARRLLPEVLAEAFADPRCVDRESLEEVFLAKLDERFTEPVVTAAAEFAPPPEEDDEDQSTQDPPLADAS